MSIQERIDICLKTRQLAIDLMAEVLAANKTCPETAFRDALLEKMTQADSLHERGWYDPPAGGIGALFSQSGDFARLRFDTLRKEQYWPSDNHVLSENSAGLVYISPVHRQSGIIGDTGLTIYTGQDEAVKAHLSKCLSVTEQAAEYAEEGMEFRELHARAQELFKNEGLSNERTVSQTDKLGTNLGHTIPWTDVVPKPAEQEIIQRGDFNQVRDLISRKRIFSNKAEQYKIPANVVFTFEPRLEDSAQPDLPLGFFHLLVVFRDGKKEIITNFDSILKLWV